MVPYDKSDEVIKDYFALLFPTFWKGEGFPGTIVDAFSAGLPVIASDWNYNSEIVKNKINGILYPNDEMDDLYQAMKWMIDNNNIITSMKKNCIETACRYQPDEYICKIVKFIGDN